jgi:tocopherol cyclase
MALWKPESYHGRSSFNDKNFFEGCYYKLISKDENYAYAIIAGASFGKDKDSSHSFIQVYDGKESKYGYHKFDIDDFYYSTKKLEMRVKDSYFTLNEVKLRINDELGQIEGDLYLDNIHPWPSACFSPGAMGWFELMPFMECYYGILSFNNSIKGSLSVKGNDLDFTGGKGYIEKNWGKSFPESWIWIQSNHFDTDDASIVVSVATIPFLTTTFPGFVIGFWHQGKLYQFCTYTGGKITSLNIEKVSSDKTKVSLITKSKHYELHIEAVKMGGYNLKAPVVGGMTGRCDESLTSTIDVSLYKTRKGNKELVFEEKGRNAGFEINGDMSKLYKKYN